MKNGVKKKLATLDEVAELRQRVRDAVADAAVPPTAEAIASFLDEENRGRLGRVLRKLRETKHIRGKGTTRAMVYTATKKAL